MIKAEPRKDSSRHKKKQAHHALLSHVAVPLSRSPGFPPGERYVTASSHVSTYLDYKTYTCTKRKAQSMRLAKRMQTPKCIPFRSVDTPVANRPVEATAREPARSTRLAKVPPWIVFRRFCEEVVRLDDQHVVLFSFLFVSFFCAVSFSFSSLFLRCKEICYIREDARPVPCCLKGQNELCDSCVCLAQN